MSDLPDRASRERRSLRLFVALELPPEAVRALAAFRDAADPDVWRPVPDASLHVTLAFLGATEEDALPCIATALEGAVARADVAPRLALAGPLQLPPRRARVLCAAIADPSGALTSFQATVAAGLVDIGVLEPEARPFRAHVTVGRLRPRVRAPRELPDGLAPEPVAFTAGPVTLFSSRTHPSGARYEALVSVQFRR